MAEEQETEATEPGAGKVDVEAIRQLLMLMEEHGLAELEIEQEDMAVRLRKAGQNAPAPAPTVIAAAPPPAPAVPAPEAAPEEEESLPTIDSPMVGTFYEASSPDADPFVGVGDHVEESTIVCVVEAMKVFNEIRAEKSGTIEAVLVKNATPVEFGQPLFAIRLD